MDLAPGECVAFAGLDIVVEMVAKSGRSARLCITAPKTVSIRRAQNEAESGTKHGTLTVPDRG